MGGQFSARTIPNFMVRIFLMEISADYNDGSEPASLSNQLSSGELKMNGAGYKVKLLDIDWSVGCYHETTYFKDLPT